MLLRFLTLPLPIALVLACTAETPSDDAASGATEIVADRCAGASAVDACLAREGCAWGNEGRGDVCFYIGTVHAQPGTGDPGGGYRRRPVGTTRPIRRQPGLLIR